MVLYLCVVRCCGVQKFAGKSGLAFAFWGDHTEGGWERRPGLTCYDGKAGAAFNF